MEEAKELILSKVEQEVRHEATQLMKDIEQRAREEADKRHGRSLPWRSNVAQPIMLPKQPSPWSRCRTKR